jgi:hypothetical protein
LEIFAIADSWKEPTGFEVDRSYRPVRIRVPPATFVGKGGGVPRVSVRSGRGHLGNRGSSHEERSSAR